MYWEACYFSYTILHTIILPFPSCTFSHRRPFCCTVVSVRLSGTLLLLLACIAPSQGRCLQHLLSPCQRALRNRVMGRSSHRSAMPEDVCEAWAAGTGLPCSVTALTDHQQSVIEQCFAPNSYVYDQCSRRRFCGCSSTISGDCMLLFGDRNSQAVRKSIFFFRCLQTETYWAYPALLAQTTHKITLYTCTPQAARPTDNMAFRLGAVHALKDVRKKIS